MNISITKKISALFLFGLLSVQGFAGGMGKKDIVDTAVEAGDFSTLVTAVQAADLVQLLKGDGPFTVFAPTDSAFSKISQASLEALIADKESLTQVLGLHVIPGKIMAKDVVTADTAQSVLGQKLSFTQENGSVFINGSKVVATDIETTNGVIHVIDTVILN